MCERKARRRLNERLTIEEYREAFERHYNRQVRPRYMTRMKEATQRRIERLLKFAGWLVNRRKR